MRFFTAFPPGKAIDLAFDIKCSTAGPEEIDDSIKMISKGYKLEIINSKERSGFVLHESIYATAEILNGVRIIEDVVGDQRVTSFKSILKLMEFCLFDGSNFEFLQYLGSGIVGSSSLLESHRVVALARDDDLHSAGIEIPNDVQRNSSGKIILADSKDAFIR